MKKIIALLITSILGFGMAAHAADAVTKESAQQLQIKKLRAQAATQHKRGDALTAKADKLKAEASAKPSEKMRSARMAVEGGTPPPRPSLYKSSPKSVAVGGIRG